MAYPVPRRQSCRERQTNCRGHGNGCSNQRDQADGFELETPADAKTDRISRVIKLGDTAEVERLQYLAEQVYMDRFKGSAENPADAQILADPAAQSLVVSGRNEHVKAIEEIVAELRLKTKQPDRISRVIKLGDTAEVERLQSLAEQVYLDRFKGSAENPADAQILADPAAQSLVVSGSIEHVQAIGGDRCRASPENQATPSSYHPSL